jgi:hypothetical protein
LELHWVAEWAGQAEVPEPEFAGKAQEGNYLRSQRGVPGLGFEAPGEHPKENSLPEEPGLPEAVKSGARVQGVRALAPQMFHREHRRKFPGKFQVVPPIFQEEYLNQKAPFLQIHPGYPVESLPV